MIAAFLKNADGGIFNYIAVIISLALFAVVISFAVIQLRRALQKGYIWLVNGHSGYAGN